MKPTFQDRVFLFSSGEDDLQGRDECETKMYDQIGWLMIRRPMRGMADNEPKQKPGPELQRGSKRVTKNGGYTIPAQMFQTGLHPTDSWRLDRRCLARDANSGSRNREHDAETKLRL